MQLSRACFLVFSFSFNVSLCVYFRLQVGEVVTTIPSRFLVLYISIQSSTCNEKKMIV